MEHNYYTCDICKARLGEEEEFITFDGVCVNMERSHGWTYSDKDHDICTECIKKLIEGLGLEVDNVDECFKPLLVK